jgi:amino acid adenylation domain-containing protein
VVASGRASRRVSKLPPLDAKQRDAALLSAPQERLWLLEQVDPADGFYRINSLGRVRGRLDIAALGRAVELLGVRHASLRARFPSGDGGVPVPRFALEPEHLDFQDLSGSAVEDSKVQSWLAHETGARLDAEKGPVFGVALAKLSAAEHLLSLSTHHLISDGWSTRILIDELAVLYGQLSRGETPVLPDVGATYGDYVHWRRGWPKPVLDEQLSYWRKALLGLPTAAVLPGDRSGPVSSAGGTLLRNLSPEQTRKLRGWARAQGVSVFTAITAMLSVLLHRYCGAQDLVLACPVAGRSHGGIERIVGCFINTVLLRLRIDGGMTMSALLQHTSETVRQAAGNQDVPLEQVLDGLEGSYHEKRMTPFGTMVNGRPDAWGLRLPGLEVEEMVRPTKGAPFPFALYVCDADYLQLRVGYQLCRYSEACVSRYLDQLELLASQVIDDPSRALVDYDLIDATSAKQLPDPGAVLERRDFHLLERVAHVARSRPGLVAIEDGERACSYAELCGGAAQVAKRLEEEGIGRGETVAVAGPVSIEAVTAMLGVLARGAVLLTLDASLPTQRKAQILAQARCRCALGLGPAPPWLSAIGPRGDVRWLKLQEGLGPRTQAFAPSEPGQDDAAYIFTTSGSTGAPRAVVGTYRGLGHFLEWQRDTFRVEPGDRCAQVTALSFDVVLREIFTPLTSGATLCLPPPGVRDDPDEMLPWLRKAGVTLLHVVPSLAARWFTGSGEPLEHLRWIFSAGEPLTDTAVRQWRGRVPRGCGIVNLYGPTETTLAKCYYVVPEEPRRGLQPVGVPLPGAQILIVDAKGRPCALGQPGEVIIRTEYRSAGYLDDAESTAQHFKRSPWRPDDVVYFTGDHGRRLDDGLIEVTGRLDGQVKIRGVRIDPAEIAATLGRHPEVASCVVVGDTVVHSDGAKSVQLIAYVVPRGSRRDAAELRTFVIEWLPPALIPAQFVFLDRLPLLPNGKVDVRSLRPLEASAVLTQVVEPRTPLEDVVARLFSEILGKPDLGAHDDFFALGGQSLLAAQVMARLRRVTGVDLSLATIFSAPTVALLAREVKKVLSGGATASAPPIPRQKERRRGELSFGQHRFFILDRLEPGSTAYNLARADRLLGELNPSALERSLEALARRHAILRTRIVVKGGHPVQEISDVATSVLRREDLKDREPDLVMAHLEQEATRPFDLERGPLWRATLFRSSPTEHVLVLVVHHIIADGWSLSLWADELSRCYRAFAAGGEPSLAPLSVEYLDFAAWQRRSLRGPELERQLGYWRAKLADLPEELPLPAERPRAEGLRAPAGRVTRVLPSALVSRLVQLSRRHDATLFVTLLAAFKAVLARYAGRDDLVVGCPVAGRERVELEALLGLFTSTVVLRTDISGARTFAELVAAVRSTVLEAYAHPDVPFERLVLELAPSRRMGQNPLFQVMFALHNLPRRRLQLPGIEVRPVELEPGIPKFDWFVSLRDQAAGGLRLDLEYDQQLFDGRLIERFADTFEQVLGRIADDPDEPLSSLIQVGAPPKIDVTPTIAAPCKTLHGLFVEQARRTPHAPALRERDAWMSYAELDERSRLWAQRLLHLGVEGESAVAVVLEPSFEYATALLAVLRAAGAYVPLEPSQPPARLEQIVTDAKVRIVISRGPPPFPLPQGVRHFDVDHPPTTAPRQLREPRSGPDTLAYVIYTSGSTGAPKGVEGTHRAMVNRLAWMWDTYPYSADDVACLKTSPAFVDAVAEIFAPLLRGVPCVIAPPKVARDARALVDLLAHEKVTRLTLVPSLLGTLLETMDNLGQRLPRLKLWQVSGEALRPETRDGFARALPGRILLNLYGSTEVAADATFADVTASAGPVSIGHPIANMSAHVLDDHLRPVPLGVTGELYIGGVGLARGYRGQPAETATRFVPVPGLGRLFRTGDRTRQNEVGELLFVGRNDHQLKVRGQRVELGDVESQLRRHPQVREVLVVGRNVGAGEHAIVAYVVGSPELDVQALRTWLRRWLPDYMLPSAFVRLTALPLLPSGKPDRQALPAPARTGSGPGETGLTPAEQQLATLWRELLEVDVVRPHDDFFALGGHSLLAMKLLVDLERRLGRRVSLATFFANPTLAGLEAALGNGSESSPSPLVALAQGGAPAIVLVHALGGGLFCYRELAVALAPRHAVWGLQGLRHDEKPASIGELAERYLGELRNVPGPHVLVGWSMGGAIAFEMARRAALPEQHLVLLDSWVRGGPAAAVHTDADWVRAIHDNHRRALRAYVAEPWRGEALLIRGGDEPSLDSGDDSLGWSALCKGGLVVERAPGDHQTMLQGRGAAVVADSILRYLARRPVSSP